ncbi:MAG: flagellar biosynthesis protein FlhF [Planctomycetota bacterium]|nr:flagellar biosynthesis protein FlhF [Planctomycetota bacterium]MED5400742.1 flagellar biosynthesis protein FlhF [Planctomycetota bacterium]
MTDPDVRTYRAATIHEALRLLENDLGRDAVILHTRQIEKRGWLPWTRVREEVEITAGLGWTVAPAMAATTSPKPAVVLFEDSSQSSFRDTPSATTLSSVPPAGPAESFTRMPQELTTGMTDRLASLEERFAQLDSNSTSPNAMVPPELFDLYTELVDSGLEEALALEFVFALKREAIPGEISDPALCRARLVKMVEDEFEAAASIAATPGQRRVVALIGPTGVGKTTTIAKLAANLKLRDGVRMGLVTVDTYRIAAVEQLRTYAEIIDLPMKVVTTSMEMRRALDEFSDMDLVLIDTAGRSPRDELQIGELKSLLADAKVDEVHLVLSLTAGLEFLTATVEHFSSVGTSSLVLTKLDEAQELGVMLNLARRVGLPVSYLTTGQDVPDDIEPAETQRMARLVLGQDRLLAPGTGSMEVQP